MSESDKKNNDWKDEISKIIGTESSLNERADSIVKLIWRPVCVGLLVGLPTLYLVSNLIIGKRYKTSAHIPQEVFEKSKFIRGKVTAVGDSDNFRLYHTPGFGWGWFRHIPKTRKELQNQTISIRIAGVDAPECAHFGMPAQPFSAEAKQYLTKMILNKKVSVQLFSRDQYNRVVGMAYVRNPPFYFKKNVSMEMIKAGLASIYVAKGAQYGGLFKEFEKQEAKAKYRKKGMWSLKTLVSPGDHKAKYLGGGGK